MQLNPGIITGTKIKLNTDEIKFKIRANGHLAEKNQ